MSLESNSGTQYHALSCGVASDVGVDIESNISTGYFYKESNDYILWGQDTTYPQLSTNIATDYYFLECDVPSDSGLDLESNSGSKYYYSEYFNCISFCDSSGEVSDSLIYNGESIVYNGDYITYNG